MVFWGFFLSSLDCFSQLDQSSGLACCATPQILVLESWRAALGKQERDKCLCLHCAVTVAVMLWPSRTNFRWGCPSPAF